MASFLSQSSTSWKKRSNASWDQLCSIATELFPQYGARPAAFGAACRRRPDLVATAIDPLGSPLIPGSPARVAQPTAVPRQSIVDHGWKAITDRLNDEAGSGEKVPREATSDRGARPWARVIAEVEGRP